MKFNSKWKIQMAFLAVFLGLSFSCTRDISVPISPSFTQSTPTPTATNTGTSTFTFTLTATNTFTFTNTNTFTNTPTFTFTPTFTNTNPGGFTSTFTNTPTVTDTPTNTFTFTPTNTPTFTFTPTDTPTNTFTGTPTGTPTNTATNTPDPNLIDDFEDNDGQISPASGGFNGFWNSNSDGTAGSNISPAAAAWADSSPGNGSTYAAHVTCGPVTSYANFGFQFMNPAASVDLSAYTGIVFDVKMDGGSGSNILKVSVSDVDTDAAGGVCASCSDYHSGNVCMTTSWQSVTIFWSQLAQAGWGNPQAAFKPAQVYGVFFQFPPNQPMGVWLDNVRLTTATAPGSLTNKAISDFDFNTGGTNINPGLTGLPAGNLGWTVYVNPAAPVNGTIQLPFVQCGGYTTNLVGGAGNFGARLNASWTGDASYPSATLTANLYNGGTYFNASSFTGIDYWIKVTTMTAPAALSCTIPLSTTTDSCCGGTCTTGCWDHFTSYNVPAANNTWTHETISFATGFARGGWGGSLAPCSSTVLNDGCNSLNVMQVQWAAASGASAGAPACDFWVDNLTFY